MNVADTKRSPCREPRTDAEQMPWDVTERSEEGLRVKAGLRQACECLRQPKSLCVQAAGGARYQWAATVLP